VLARDDHGSVVQLDLSRDDEIDVRGGLTRTDDRRARPVRKTDEGVGEPLEVSVGERRKERIRSQPRHAFVRHGGSVGDGANEELKHGLTARAAVF